MTSKVLVKLPTVPFPQGKKPSSDVVALPEKKEGSNQTVRHSGGNIDKVAQLEQNMKFLQEQHQATLAALHQEVKSLRQKNGDLQFQLVFSKRSTYALSSPSSPESSETGFVKPKVELLEKDLQDTKISLQEAKTKNQHLSEIIEQQKKKLDSMEEEKAKKQSVTDIGIQVDSRNDQVDLVTCLEVAEAMVKRLHKQNEDQRKEIAALKAVSASTTNSNKGARSRDNNNSHYSRGSPTSTTQEQASHKFPPLQSQSYWHHRAPRNGRNRNDKQDHQWKVDSTVLPQLQNDSMKSDSVIFKHPAQRFRPERSYYENRKYKRHMGDRTDTHHHHHHRRDYKDRNSKDHEKDLDSVDGSREGNNSSGSKS
ncbi:uncharacterized protein LOC143184855 isoform X2 [Calliopsis andreniformis]|uniref:uncharacterized protein LOC143184855 isoform X2 n=1 Tax=Calliopsis andreniformis TaxID=337506 RepID=UPI003FCD534D